MKDRNHSVLIHAEKRWQESEAEDCGLSLEEFTEILITEGRTKNYGLPSGQRASKTQRTAFFDGLCLPDLILARACAIGKELAWERFMARYRERLFQVAIEIARNETLGNDIASFLLDGLYGLTTGNDMRNSLLNSYSGSGSLMGWLRTILARRVIDHHRKPKTEVPLGDYDKEAPEPEAEPNSDEIFALGNAVEQAVKIRPPEERYLLRAYYLDKRTQTQIARFFGVNGATISRWLERLTKDIRKQTCRNLQIIGMSKRQAEEVLGTDPRDLNVNLSRLLQNERSQPLAGEGGQ